MQAAITFYMLNQKNTSGSNRKFIHSYFNNVNTLTIMATFQNY